MLERVERACKEVAMKSLGAVAVLAFVVVVGGTAGAQNDRPAGSSLREGSFGKLPLYFVENRGVYPDEVAYYIQGADKTLFFTRDGITFRLKGKDRGWVVKLEFVGASPHVVPRGESRQQAVISYFEGPREDWKTGLRTYSRVVYRSLWPGIDLVYHGSVNKLKYAFRVAPGADPATIRLRYRGASSVTTTDAGALRVETPVGSLEDAPPAAWQEIGGERVPVKMRYRLEGGGEFGFHLGDYDRTQPLVLDPLYYVYCGFLGGAGDDIGSAITVDGSGSAYVTGLVDSDERSFPVTVGPDKTYNGRGSYWPYYGDAFVAKLNAAGTALLYCGYIGGSAADWGERVAVDASGNAYVTGLTGSSEQTFPVVGGPDPTYNGGLFDAFVAKVNPQGTALLYCGYIGGAGEDYGYGIAVDPSGNAYVVGATGSDEKTFPVAVGPDLTYNGQGDAFVAKVNAGGKGLAYCGYIGGEALDSGYAVVVDTLRNAYVVGTTGSGQQSFPVIVGPDLSFNGGTYDAFAAKVNPQGSALSYCGYIGGSAIDRGQYVAVDKVGNAFVVGDASSTEQSFPVKVGPDLTYNGGASDGFVAEINPPGNGLVYCGYIGGAGSDHANTVVLDATGSAYVSGISTSDERTFPVTVGPDLTFNGGTYDGYVARVSPPGTALLFCGYIGGKGDDIALGIALDGTSNVYVTGKSDSSATSFPVTVGPDLTQNGIGDAFVAKIELADVSGSGATRPGSAVTLHLVATNSAGLPYQLGTALGTGPIWIGSRRLDLSSDGLLVVSVQGLWPQVFLAYRGILDAQGRTQAAVQIPNHAALIGIRLHSAFVTFDAAAPGGIRSISGAYSFTITK
jgi:hypothetical protein